VSDVAGHVEEEGGGLLAEDGAVGHLHPQGGGRLPEPVL
jgi:hypothetical protein